MYQRTSEMSRLKLEGKTLQYIGDRFDISRERVRQILSTTGIKYPHAKVGEKVERENRTCPHCKNTFRIKKTLSKVFCSQKCHYASKFKTPEQKRIYHLEKARQWYNLMKEKYPIQLKEYIRHRNKGEKVKIADFIKQ